MGGIIGIGSIVTLLIYVYRQGKRQGLQSSRMDVVDPGSGAEEITMGGNLEPKEGIGQEIVQEPETRGGGLRYPDEERLGTASSP